MVMKKIIYLFLAVLLFSCSEKPKGFDSKIFTEKEVSDFIRVNPDWTESTEKESATTEKFKHKLINLSNEPNFLTDIPLQLKTITDTTVSGQTVKLAVFKSYKDSSRPKESLLNQLELEIQAIMSADQVSNLVIDKKYTLKGMVYKQGKRGDVNFYHDGEIPVYKLGKYTFWNIQARPI
jgi:hypothetical protein